MFDYGVMAGPERSLWQARRDGAMVIGALALLGLALAVRLWW